MGKGINQALIKTVLEKEEIRTLVPGTIRPKRRVESTTITVMVITTRIPVLKHNKVGRDTGRDKTNSKRENLQARQMLRVLKLNTMRINILTTLIAAVPVQEKARERSMGDQTEDKAEDRPDHRILDNTMDRMMDSLLDKI